MQATNNHLKITVEESLNFTPRSNRKENLTVKFSTNDGDRISNKVKKDQMEVVVGLANAASESDAQNFYQMK